MAFGLDPRFVYFKWREREVWLWAEVSRDEQEQFALLQAAAVIDPKSLTQAQEQVAATSSQGTTVERALEAAERIRGMIDSGSGESEKRKRIRRRAADAQRQSV